MMSRGMLRKVGAVIAIILVAAMILGFLSYLRM